MLDCAPMYPGAYNYVLGIEDRPRPPFGYTNYDQDGPILQRFATLLNYELAAPGTGIMSTVQMEDMLHLQELPWLHHLLLELWHCIIK